MSPPPNHPPEMPRETHDLFDGAHWHQRWEVFPGVFTPGVNCVQQLLDRAGIPSSLAGRRVLDVGTYNGCVAFECERRGAAEVTAMDIMNPDRTGFHKLHHALDSKVRYVRGSVYELDPEVHGTFDLVLFFGVLYHLRYPHLALDRLRTICERELLVETHVLEGGWAAPSWAGRVWGRLIARALRKTPVWRQYRPYELHPEDASNLMGPNVAALLASLADCGFDATPVTVGRGRATVRAMVKDGQPSRVARDSYEARYAPDAGRAGVALRADPLFGQSDPDS